MSRSRVCVSVLATRTLAGLVGLACLACGGGSGDPAVPVLDPCGAGAHLAFLHPEQVPASSGSQLFTLAGILLGDVREAVIVRQGSAGETTVARIEQGPRFEIPTVPLTAGHNRFVLRGRSADGALIEDTTTVIYNPEGLVPFGRIEPDFAFVGEEAVLLVRLDANRIDVLDAGLELWTADGVGLPRDYVGTMADDGDLAGSGDEIAGDGVWAARIEAIFDLPGLAHYVVVVYGRREGVPVERYAPRLDVRVVEPLDAATCRSEQAFLQDLLARFDALRGEQGFDEARATLVEEARADPRVVAAGAPACADSVWVRFADGVGGVLPLATRRDLPSPATEPVAFEATWEAEAVVADRVAWLVGDNPDLVASLAPDACPALLPGAVPVGARALPYDWHGAHAGGLVYVRGDGVLAFAGEAGAAAARGAPAGAPLPLVIQAHEDPCRDLGTRGEECSYDPIHPGLSRACASYGKQCMLKRRRGDGSLWGACIDPREPDLRAGRLVLTPEGYGVTPALLASVLPEGSGGVALLDVPRADRDAHLAATFLTQGYGLVAARRGRGGEAPFGALVDDLLGAESWSAADHPDLRLFGSTRVGYTPYRVTNGTFEEPGLVGWRSQGDARRVTGFADATPAEGKGMLLLSTGLGFTDAGGSVEQVFCPPPGSKALTLRWRLFSEEFVEQCGYSEYQDEFLVSLEVGGEETRVLEASINRLCPPDADVGVCGVCLDPDAANCPCGSLHDDDLSLIEGLHFDVADGDVWATGWREASFLLPFAGIRPVTLRLEVRDRGDSQIDTAVLIDAIEAL